MTFLSGSSKGNAGLLLYLVIGMLLLFRWEGVAQETYFRMYVDWVKHFPDDSAPYARSEALLFHDSMLYVAGQNNYDCTYFTFDIDGNGGTEKRFSTTRANLVWDAIYHPTDNRFYLLCSEPNTDSSLVLAVSPDGELEWETGYSYLPSTVHCSSICGLSGGGFVFAGNIYRPGDSTDNRDAIIICADSSGKVLWDTTLGDESYDLGHEVYELKNGNLLLSTDLSVDIVKLGTSSSYSVKYAFGLDWFSPAGELFRSVKGVTKAGRAEYNRILEDSEGNIYLCGTIDRAVSVRKFNAQGDSLWHYLFPKRYNDLCNAAEFMGDSLLVVGSYLLQTGISPDPRGAYVHLFNKNGTLYTSQFVKELTQAENRLSGLVCTDDSTFFISGNDRNQSWLVRMKVRQEQLVSVSGTCSIVPSRKNQTRCYDISGRKIPGSVSGQKQSTKNIGMVLIRTPGNEPAKKRILIERLSR